MQTQWCPYTDQHLDLAEMNDEHVIPLSLGGHNQFTIPVERVRNSELGNKIDAAISSNPLVASARRHYGLLGHTKRDPIVRWPAHHKGMNGTLDLTNEEIKFITYRSLNPHGLNLSLTPQSSDSLTSNFNFDENLILSFGAKLALGTSTFLFGDTFRNHGYHNELRSLMNSSTPIDDLKFMVSSNGGKSFWVLTWPKSLQTASVLPPWFDAVLGQPDKNFAFTLHTTSEVILGCSILSGFYRWYFNVAKDPERFPIGGDFELGAVIDIDLKPRQFRQSSLRDYLSQLVKIET